jgi:hypothetical protein
VERGQDSIEKIGIVKKAKRINLEEANLSFQEKISRIEKQINALTLEI